MNHSLKTEPHIFCRLVDGSRTFEFTKNDLGFQPGDQVTFHEWDGTPQGAGIDSPKGKTGESISFTVGYIQMVSGNMVIFSLLPAPKKPKRK